MPVTDPALGTLQVVHDPLFSSPSSSSVKDGLTSSQWSSP
jgi:hypothetical protein